MPEPGQPGGSGAGSTVEDQWLDWISVHAVECVESDHERCAWDATRTDLEAARREIEKWSSATPNDADLAAGAEWWARTAIYWRVRHEHYYQSWQIVSADLAQARARIAALEGEIEVSRNAIRLWKSNWDSFGKDHPEVFEADRQQARERLSALDAAQAAGAGQEQPCCSQDQPHTSNPKCPAGEKHWVSSQWSWADRPELQLADDDEPPGEPGSYKRAIGALAGQDLRLSPETAVRRVRDNDNSEPDHTDVATDTRAEDPQEAV